MSWQRIVGILLIVLLLLGVVWFFVARDTDEESDVQVAEDVEIEAARQETIGTSVEGRPIERYTYGNGEKHLLFVGGIHGGYEWNSVLLAYQFIDLFEAEPEKVPKDLMVTIIPVLNPDGLHKVVGSGGRFDPVGIIGPRHSWAPGRFNAHGVDLNRNFACKWAPESTWRGQKVSAGTSAFSEPEARVLQRFVTEHAPDAVVFWHSKAGAVYASECEEGVLPETLAITHTYAAASGYMPVETFDAYPITGDAEGWLATLNIPAITVEFETGDSVEWEENYAGVQALFDYFSGNVSE